MLSAMKFSNDQRVLQSSPKVLRISLFLESSAGHYVTYTLVSLPAVAALVLAIASRLEAAARVITLQVFLFWPLSIRIVPGTREISTERNRRVDTAAEGTEARASGNGSSARR